MSFVKAFNYHGETILAEDKCGLAIKCLQESKSRKYKFVLSTYLLCDRLKSRLTEILIKWLFIE